MVVCMFSICLFFACRWNCSPLPFFLFTLLCTYVFYVLFALICLQIFDFLRQLFPLSFPFWLLCAHSNCAMHPPHSFSQRGTSLGRSLRPAGWALGYQRVKLKQYLSLFAFLLFYCGNPEHTERTRSATAEQDDHWQCIPLWCYCEQLQC